MAINYITINQLISYFIIYSIGGWLLESAYRSFCEKKIVNSGFLHGPYCPIYGVGTIIMVIFLQDIKRPEILFIIGFVVLTVLEYIVGIVLEKLFHTKYWDYSHEKFNIKGRICLINSIYWGILAIIFTLIIHPNVQKFIQAIPIQAIITINAMMLIILLIDTIISIEKIKSLESSIEELKQITVKIKEKIETLKIDTQNKISDRKIKDEITELQNKKDNITVAVYKQLIRIKEAFPTINSEFINKFLNNKFDVEDLKKKVNKIKIIKKKEGKNKNKSNNRV